MLSTSSYMDSAGHFSSSNHSYHHNLNSITASTAYSTEQREEICRALNGRWIGYALRTKPSAAAPATNNPNNITRTDMDLRLNFYLSDGRIEGEGVSLWLSQHIPFTISGCFNKNLTHCYLQKQHNDNSTCRTQHYYELTIDLQLKQLRGTFPQGSVVLNWAAAITNGLSAPLPVAVAAGPNTAIRAINAPSLPNQPISAPINSLNSASSAVNNYSIFPSPPSQSERSAAGTPTTLSSSNSSELAVSREPRAPETLEEFIGEIFKADSNNWEKVLALLNSQSIDLEALLEMNRQDFTGIGMLVGPAIKIGKYIALYKEGKFFIQPQ
jgi:hypothetical protein